MNPEKQQVDVIVLGAGYAGALTAMIARKNGCNVLLVEKGRHPRMMIGESTTPLTNLLLEEIANEFHLPFLLDFSQWGKWKRLHPDLKVGLKRGFGFYNHCTDQKVEPSSLWNKELLVAASPSNFVADTHWWRADWDSFLVDQCRSLGIEYWDKTEALKLCEEKDGISLTLQNEGGQLQVKGSLLIDATGGGNGVARLLRLKASPLEHTPDTFAVYSHFEEVATIGSIEDFNQERSLPYPPENAAIHHMIDDGWVWSLRFDHGTVSAGAILKESSYEYLKEKTPDFIWQHLLKHYPKLGKLFQHVNPIYPIRRIDRVGFQMEKSHGNRWIMLPSSAGFVDPLLSTGFPLTLLGIQRLGKFLAPSELRKQGLLIPLRDIAKLSRHELNLVDRLIGTLFATMNDFRHFAVTTLIYFAIVSFSETARRLGRHHQSSGFLLSEQSEMSKKIISTLEKIQKIHQSKDSPEVKWATIQALVESTIEPINVIGLSTRSNPPHFPAKFGALFENADKLGVSKAEIQSMLERLNLTSAQTD